MTIGGSGYAGQVLHERITVLQESKMTTPAQQSIVAAFNELVLERPFDEFHVADIIGRADVSRSTFYQHFNNKEALLRHSLSNVLAPIAKASCEEISSVQLVLTLEYFRDVKPVISNYFRSPILEMVESLLSEEIQNQLTITRQFETKFDAVDLVCKQLAASVLALIKSWLRTDSEWEAAKVAMMIIASSKSIREAACGLP